jgi:hypothetical protein
LKSGRNKYHVSVFYLENLCPKERFGNMLRSFPERSILEVFGFEDYCEMRILFRSNVPSYF